MAESTTGNGQLTSRSSLRACAALSLFSSLEPESASIDTYERKVFIWATGSWDTRCPSVPPPGPILDTLHQLQISDTAAIFLHLQTNKVNQYIARCASNVLTYHTDAKSETIYNMRPTDMFIMTPSCGNTGHKVLVSHSVTEIFLSSECHAILMLLSLPINVDKDSFP